MSLIQKLLTTLCICALYVNTRVARWVYYKSGNRWNLALEDAPLRYGSNVECLPILRNRSTRYHDALTA
jgi:hypothetical protein